MQQDTPNKLFIIGALLVFFVVAPLISWFIVPHHSAHSTRNAKEFYTLISQYNETEATDRQVPDITIKSIERVKDVWYVLTVVSKDTHESDKMLVADFYHDPSKMSVLSLPFEVALQKNISGMGVPYSIMDELNPNLAGGSSEN